MRTNVPEKLLAIVDDIDAKGDASLTRLTILKKWFERPGRLVPFALWVADRASSRKGKTKGEAAELFREARGLLKGVSASPESRRIHKSIALPVSDSMSGWAHSRATTVTAIGATSASSTTGN